MQEFLEALNKGDTASEETQPLSKKSSIFSHLTGTLSGLSISKSVSSVQISQRGVDYMASCDDAQTVMSHLLLDDCQLEVFGNKYKVRRRGGSVVVYSDIDITENDDHGLVAKINSFLTYVTSGSGISFIGSPTLSLTVRLVDLISLMLPEPSCNVFFDGSKFTLSEYDVNTNKVINSISRGTLAELMLCVDLSPYKYVFIEGYSGVCAVPDAVSLAISGKRVIYVQNSISSLYALYSAMQSSDAQVLSAIFSGSLFVDSLSFVKGAALPKVEFEQHKSFTKWGALKTSPTRNELVLINPQCGLIDVSKRELIIAEEILPSKSTSKWICEKINPVDFAGNLRLDQGWSSIADEAAIAVREEAVTFDQVLEKISII